MVPTPSHLEVLLEKVEQHVLSVRNALLGDDPALLESQCQQLQASVTELFRCYEQLQKLGVLPKKLNLRMKELSSALTLVRESLLRKSAFVDQALQIIFPSNAPSTYAPKSSPYGAAIRNSGKFGGYSA